MLDIAVKYRQAIDNLVAVKKKELRKYELDDDEWSILKDLLRVLKFSREGLATIAHVLPAMDKIDDMLSSEGTASLNPAIKLALRQGQKVMNKYYSATDDSYAYRIAMILHPGLKMKYFELSGWEQDWVDNAGDIVKSAFTCYVTDSLTDDALEGSTVF
ncbi:hypothetical protein B0H12DRAFT_1024597 [Mycena haematopus]|nr:hypothetical protein B0H12DRAFT_1024597 [Mycena haematopus]